MSNRIEDQSIEDNSDDTDFLAEVQDLLKYRLRKAYQEFWSDICWQEPPGDAK